MSKKKLVKNELDIRYRTCYVWNNLFWLRHPLNTIHELRRHRKWHKQRIEYGWCEMDVANVDNYLECLLPQLLRILARFPDEPFNTPTGEYHKELEKSAKAIDAWHKLSKDTMKDLSKTKQYRDFRKALKFIADNWTALWT